jgi:hypothetical protein
MNDKTVFTFFIHLRATPAWLALSRPGRAAYVQEAVRPAFTSYPSVKARFFDAEAFTGRCSDVAMIETDDLRQYRFLIDALRDEAFFGLPYFEVLEIIPAVEDGYVDYDRETGLNAEAAISPPARLRPGAVPA